MAARPDLARSHHTARELNRDTQHLESASKNFFMPTNPFVDGRGELDFFFDSVPIHGFTAAFFDRTLHSAAHFDIIKLMLALVVFLKGIKTVKPLKTAFHVTR